MTTSLYVPGKLADTENVLVDVGTGYYVEKNTKDAIKFYEGKAELLGKSLADLEKVVGQKSQNLRVVEDGIFFFSASVFKLIQCSIETESTYRRNFTTYGTLDN